MKSKFVRKWVLSAAPKDSEFRVADLLPLLPKTSQFRYVTEGDIYNALVTLSATNEAKRIDPPRTRGTRWVIPTPNVSTLDAAGWS